MKRFADRLREARVAMGLTQEQLGFAVGVTKSSVSAWENGRETPSFHALPRLRAALHRSLDELVCGLAESARESQQESATDRASESSLVARDEKERAVLLRYRSLSARRRAALLELLGPT